ncbi:MAG: HPr-rel-A system PqqD family peptide chaperone [Burkholderiales bacterium]|nr:HPr-rel-A system PqqD family peptide chaperone [Burkholderiales bacterium]
MTRTPETIVRQRTERFSARRLGKEIALFDVHSGKTHLLDTSLATIFDLLSDAPKTKGSLIAEAAPLLTLWQGDIENFIDHGLLELQDIGLIDITESS